MPRPWPTIWASGCAAWSCCGSGPPPFRSGLDWARRALREVRRESPVVVTRLWRTSLGELFGAYGALMQRGRTISMIMPARRLMTPEAALERLAQLLTGQEWRDLASFLPGDLGDPLVHRSAIASSLIASLELARQGAIELRQAAPFAPIMVRRRP